MYTYIKMGVIKVIILFQMIMSVQSLELTSNLNNSAAGSIDGETLTKMSKLMNKPVLSLIGAAINNMHPCGQWTDWSKCTASRPDHFGIKRRTRKCSNISESMTKRSEEEFKVCKGVCPANYEITTNGFCLKLYTLKKSFIDAKKQCEIDGGNLVKVDTEVKYEDIWTLNGISTFGYIYIDGNRKDTKSAWIFATQSRSIFFHWAKTQPDNGLDQLCLVVNGSEKLMSDGSCEQLWNFICEMNI